MLLAAGPPRGCARMAASTLSFFSRAGRSLALQRVHQVRIEAVILRTSTSQAQPKAASNAAKRARRQAADHAQDRLHAIGHVAVGEHLAI
jgi:hypothetical protein